MQIRLFVCMQDGDRFEMARVKVMRKWSGVGSGAKDEQPEQ